MVLCVSSPQDSVLLEAEACGSGAGRGLARGVPSTDIGTREAGQWGGGQGVRGLSFVPLLQSPTASPVLLASGALNGSPRKLEASLLRSPLYQMLVPRVLYASHPSLFSPKVGEL